MDTLKQTDAGDVELAASLADQGVELAVGGWIDVLGRPRAKFVPIHHLPGMLAGSERYTPRGMGGLGEMNPSEAECVAMPDRSTLRILPWDRRVAFFNADLLFGGERPFDNCPRSILKSVVTSATELGYRFNLGVETEFYVFRADRLPELVPLARSCSLLPTPAYDAEATLDSMPFLRPLVRYLEESDFGLFSFDHEGGDGQYELDFEHAEVLAMCDRLTFFRLMLREVAKEIGAVVSFMPKPDSSFWGSGAHMNMSLESVDSGDNLFRDNDGWTRAAYNFAAGLMRHSHALSALTCPTVNSYKRLVPRLVDGSVSWAPVWEAYGDNNRSCMIRLPHNRPALENRSVDAAANMYLASAFALAAGLDGIKNDLDPGEPVTESTHLWGVDGRRAPRPRLPRHLLEAIDAFDDDELVHEVFPAGFVRDYVDMKRGEWDDYHGRVTSWEVTRYLTNL